MVSGFTLDDYASFIDVRITADDNMTVVAGVKFSDDAAVTDSGIVGLFIYGAQKYTSGESIAQRAAFGITGSNS